MTSAKQVITFNGKGDVNTFITKTELYIKLMKLEGEDAAMLMASKLEDPTFHIYLLLAEEDKKDRARINGGLKKQYEAGNSDREEALCLLSPRLRSLIVHFVFPSWYAWHTPHSQLLTVKSTKKIILCGAYTLTYS